MPIYGKGPLIVFMCNANDNFEIIDYITILNE